MKLLSALPCLLLLALACRAAPAQEQGVTEMTLPSAEMSAPLTALAARKSVV